MSYVKRSTMMLVVMFIAGRSAKSCPPEIKSAAIRLE